MKSFESTAPAAKLSGKRPQYAPTFPLGQMKDGQSVIFMPLSRSEKDDAKRASKKVPIFTVQIKGESGQKSIFWPEGCVEPNLLIPVMLTKLPNEYKFRLDVPENDAERNSLWS